MTPTTFTINTSAVKANQAILDELVAVPLAEMPTVKDGIKTDMWTCLGWGLGQQRVCFDLQEGTKFVTHKQLSRRALVRLFGRDAWVRGVNK